MSLFKLRMDKGKILSDIHALSVPCKLSLSPIAGTDQAMGKTSIGMLTTKGFIRWEFCLPLSAFSNGE
jgi:hypothetical protein